MGEIVLATDVTAASDAGALDVIDVTIATIVVVADSSVGADITTIGNVNAPDELSVFSVAAATMFDVSEITIWMPPPAVKPRVEGIAEGVSDANRDCVDDVRKGVGNGVGKGVGGGVGKGVGTKIRKGVGGVGKGVGGGVGNGVGGGVGKGVGGGVGNGVGTMNNGRDVGVGVASDVSASRPQMIISMTAASSDWLLKPICNCCAMKLAGPRCGMYKRYVKLFPIQRLQHSV